MVELHKVSDSKGSVEQSKLWGILGEWIYITQKLWISAMKVMFEDLAFKQCILGYLRCVKIKSGLFKQGDCNSVTIPAPKCSGTIFVYINWATHKPCLSFVGSVAVDSCVNNCKQFSMWVKLLACHSCMYLGLVWISVRLLWKPHRSLSRNCETDISQNFFHARCWLAYRAIKEPHSQENFLKIDSQIVKVAPDPLEGTDTFPLKSWSNVGNFVKDDSSTVSLTLYYMRIVHSYLAPKSRVPLHSTVQIHTYCFRKCAWGLKSCLTVFSYLSSVWCAFL